MLFSEIYILYRNPLRQEKVEPIICSQTKINILYSLSRMEDENKRSQLTYNNGQKVVNTEYYKMFLDSLGDINKPDYPGVCFEVYDKLYSRKWEIEVRRRQVESDKINPLLCRKFNIPERYYKHTFKRTQPKPDQTQLFNTSKNYVKAKFRESLWLGSDVRGVGKTTNAICIAMEYYVANDFKKISYFKYPYDIINNSILFIKEYDMIKLVPNKHDFSPVYYRSALLNRLAEVDLLIYDDALKYADNEFIKEFLLPLFDDRLENKSKPTIITSTFKERQLPLSYPDLYSRLRRGKVYYCDIKNDYRELK